MTHDQLCQKARAWLRGSRRCNPVFSNCASCDEIPDAIGWSSSYQHHGSTIIECKTSVSDFYADGKKKFVWRHATHKWHYPSRRINAAEAEREGYEKVFVPLMGDYRFYFCEAGVLSEELVLKHAPDHGLLWLSGCRVRTIVPAPKRMSPNYSAEIRYLRFAIINRKVSVEGESISAVNEEPEGKR